MPDLIPWADEIILGAVTMLFGMIKDRRRERRRETSEGAHDEGAAPDEREDETGDEEAGRQ